MQFEWQAVIIHLLLYPLYQIASTLRHESAHAVAALLYRYTITSFRIWPHRADDGQFYWGRVTWQLPPGTSSSSTHVMMAPYYIDIVLIVAWATIQQLEVITVFHWWLFATIMLVVSPMVDMIYNIFKALLFNRGDWTTVLPRM